MTGPIAQTGAEAGAKFFEALRAANDQLDVLARTQRERDEAVAEADGVKAELDNVVYQFRQLGSTIAGITGLMNDYHTERDDARETADQYRRALDDMREERDELATCVQELEGDRG